jgi:hypothetical protein
MFYLGKISRERVLNKTASALPMGESSQTKIRRVSSRRVQAIGG